MRVACGAEAAGAVQFPSPDHTAPRCSREGHHCLPPRPAPCRWAAASPCARRVRCPDCRCRSRFPSPDHTAPRCSRQRPIDSPRHQHLADWAAASPCDSRVRCPDCRCCSTSRWPDHTAPRCSRVGPAIESPRHQHLAIGQQRRRVIVACGAQAAGAAPAPVAGSYSSALLKPCHHYSLLPRPAPCHWAAASPCDRRVRCPGCRCCSTSQWPDHTAPRCSRRDHHSSPPATSTLPGQQRRRVTVACGAQAAGRRPASRSPDHTAPRCSRSANHCIPPPPAPCHWAAASPCVGACGAQAAGRRPRASRRIIQLRAAQGGAIVALSASHQHLAIGQQRRRVSVACGAQAAGRRPRPARRIIQLRAAQGGAIVTVSARHQHLAIGQQRRRVILTCGAQVAGRRPRPVGRIIQLRAAQVRTIALPPPATSTLPLGSSVAVCRKRAVPRLPVAVHVPVAGSYSSVLLKAESHHGSARHQHLAIGQQRRRVIRRVRCPGCRSPSTCQSPDHTAPRCSRLESIIGSARHQHLAIGQQRRRVIGACGGQAAGRRPRASRRIIQLRAIQEVRLIGWPPPPPAPCHWAVTSPCGRSRAVPRLPVAVHVPVAGSYSSALLNGSHCFRQPPAPCHWAAASPCVGSVP